MFLALANTFLVCALEASVWGLGFKRWLDLPLTSQEMLRYTWDCSEEQGRCQSKGGGDA